MVIGKTDTFERIYTERFRLLASQFGEFVHYERDRGARDIGLHLTRKTAKGNETLSSAFCWFQLKGIMAETLPLKKYKKLKEIKYPLRVEHLRFWYLQPMSTHLVIYIQSVDTFLVLNIQKYVSDKWGNKIIALDQKTATVNIPTDSILDERAFELLLRLGEISEWVKILGVDKRDEENVHLCQRDYEVIFNIGTAKDRGVEYKLGFRKWFSKLRGEVYIEEKTIGQSEWINLREHFQHMMSIDDLEDTYPYLEFIPEEDNASIDSEFYANLSEDAKDLVYDYTFKNGNTVYGKECGGIFVDYHIMITLNNLGEQMFEWVNILLSAKLLALGPNKRRFLSVAPWNSRAV